MKVQSFHHYWAVTVTLPCLVALSCWIGFMTLGRKDLLYLSFRQRSCTSLLEKVLCCLSSSWFRGWSGLSMMVNSLSSVLLSATTRTGQKGSSWTPIGLNWNSHSPLRRQGDSIHTIQETNMITSVNSSHWVVFGIHTPAHTQESTAACFFSNHAKN